MENYTLNREAIRKALGYYNEVESQKESVLKDNDIQNEYRKENIEAARKLILDRYPLAYPLHDNRRKAGIALVKAMNEGINEYSEEDAEAIYMHYVTFKKLYDLAERV